MEGFLQFLETFVVPVIIGFLFVYMVSYFRGRRHTQPTFFRGVNRRVVGLYRKITN